MWKSFNQYKKKQNKNGRSRQAAPFVVLRGFASANAPLFTILKEGISMNNSFPNSVASALALIFVEKNAKEGDHPETLLELYQDAFELIRDLETQQRAEHYQNS